MPAGIQRLREWVSAARVRRAWQDVGPASARSAAAPTHPTFALAGIAGALLLLSVCGAIAAEIAPADKRSGYTFMQRDTQATQDDDTANPATFWVLDGEALWSRKAGSANKACADWVTAP
jgi:hypothetical protein